jgi:hypothetical protein
MIKRKAGGLIIFLMVFCQAIYSQVIIHQYHLNDSLWVDSLTTSAYFENKRIFYIKQYVKHQDADDLSQYHYFLALLAFYNKKDSIKSYDTCINLEWYSIR